MYRWAFIGNGHSYLLLVWMQIAATFPKGSLKTGFSGGSLVTNLPANAGGADSIPRLGRSLREEMAIHSSILACKSPWAEEIGRLQSMRSQRVGGDWETEHTCNLTTCANSWTSLVAQTVKRLSTRWETRVWSLGREDPLEKEMATNSSTIAWKMPWTEEPGRLQSMGSQESGTTERLHFHFHQQF